MIKQAIKKLANQFGYDLLHLPSDPLLRRRMEFFRNNNINLIFDIGANTGQYAKSIRKLGYSGKIISFEPLPDAFEKLKNDSFDDREWEVANHAVGNIDGAIEIHISKNSYSSSVLNMLPAHSNSAPDTEYVNTIKVPIFKVDSMIDKYYNEGKNLFVKVDTQGFERNVFEGCANSLDKIMGFQMELSLLPLYKGETLMQDMVDLLRENGFKLMLLEQGHYNYSTGELLQVECFFLKG